VQEDRAKNHRRRGGEKRYEQHIRSPPRQNAE
jgi:hypothetical protein